jgi:transposase
MDTEEILRQEAVRLFLQGISAQKISEQLNRTRQWVYKWVKQYKKSQDTNWNKTRSNTPHSILNKTSVSLENSVVEIRKRLLNNPYAQKGAISILYEFERLGVVPPSISSINRILKRNHLIGLSLVKQTKQKEYPDYFIGVQQMDLIGPKYLKGGFKFYFYCIIDTETHYAIVYPITNKSAESITPCLIDFWTNYRLPDFLQMDNELSFRGSNRHPRGLGMILRITISNGVVPIFIPTAEPWRNGIIEKFNGNVLKYFYNTQKFDSFEQLIAKANHFSAFHNENHRYSSQLNRTPNQMVKLSFNDIRLTKNIDLSSKIMIEEGKINFIRFIRSDQDRRAHV